MYIPGFMSFISRHVWKFIANSKNNAFQIWTEVADLQSKRAKTSAVSKRKKMVVKDAEDEGDENEEEEEGGSQAGSNGDNDEEEAGDDEGPQCNLV